MPSVDVKEDKHRQATSLRVGRPEAQIASANVPDAASATENIAWSTRGH